MTSPERPRWPPPPTDNYQPVQKHPLQSLVTTLPVLMLLVGLFIFYRAEHAETVGTALYEHTLVVEGSYAGVSQIPSGGSGRHHLWFESDGRSRGPRITASQAVQLRELEAGTRMRIHMAPHVQGSNTYWAWRVEVGDRVIYDERSAPR